MIFIEWPLICTDCVREYTMKRTSLTLFLLVLAAANHAPAQDADSSSRGVARLSLLSGDVSVRRGDTGESVAAAVNGALMTEDRVLTGAGSKAEVQFDYGNFARIASDAELRLADIENNRYLLRVARGTVTYRILRDFESQAEISTPSIAVRPLKKGSYRITVLDDGTTEVAVRSGEAEIYSPQGTQKLRSGKVLRARGSSNDPEFQTVAMTGEDDWDRWNESRDRQLERSTSYNHVSRDITGAEDLDNNGRWIDTPEYGQVWVPNTSAGWAPYRHGRWSWVDYYGWSWVSYDPWGWAPYHYGRWFNRPGVGWCWWPGYRSYRHYWSPALVGFFGWGGGGWSVGVGVGFGTWGWVPLAPYETYYPWYGRGYYGGYRNYNRIQNNITIVNNTNITNIYRNARFDGGVSAVNGQDFGRGSVNTVRVNRNDLERASVMRGQLPMTPDASSTRFSDRESRVTDRAGRGGDNFYSTRQPGRVDRVAFDQQRTAIQDLSRRAFGGDNNNPVRGGGDVAGAGRGADRGGRSDFAGSGTMRDGTPAGQGDAGGRIAAGDGGRSGNSDSGRGAESRGGWRRMSEMPADSFSGRGTSGVNADAGRGAARSEGSSSRGAGDSGGWRRFGDSAAPATGSDRSVRGGESTGSASSDRGSWRRFGESSADRTSSGRGQSDPSVGTRSTESNFGRGSSDRGSSRSTGGDSSWRRMEQPSAPSGSTDRGGRGTFGGGESRSSQAPVVRQRSMSDFGVGRGSMGGRSESRSSSPAPRMERSAPSMPSGGGSRMSGGGGGFSGGGRGGSGGSGMSRGSSGGGGGGTRGGSGGGGSRGGGGRGR